MQLVRRQSQRCITCFPNGASVDGAILLEVILALVLFAAAAAVIGTGLSTAIESVSRLRLNTHAANLAVSVLSELQLGIKSAAVESAQPFPAPFEGWTWEVSAGASGSNLKESSKLKRVEVTIRHDDPPIVYRLSQTLLLPESKPAKDLSASDASARYLTPLLRPSAALVHLSHVPQAP